MDYFQFITIGIFVLVFGTILIKRLRFGSWTGAFLGGNIEHEYGEIQLSQSIAGSQVMKVVKVQDSNGLPVVGIVIKAKAPLAASMVVYRLSKDQARMLSGLLADSAS